MLWAKDGGLQALLAQPEVEIWRKWQKWILSLWLPILLPIHYEVYLHAKWYFPREAVLYSTCNFRTKSVKMSWRGRGAKMRYFWCTFDFWGRLRVWKFFWTETFSSKIRTAKVVFFVNFEADLLQNLGSCICENLTHCNRRYPRRLYDKWVSRVPNFLGVGSQICQKFSSLTPNNFKPEVDSDLVPTAFMTLCVALKYGVINFSQVAPQYA